MFSQPRNIPLATPPYAALQGQQLQEQEAPSAPPSKNAQPSQGAQLPEPQTQLKSLYFGMLAEYGGARGQLRPETRAEARDFLQQQLHTAATLTSDFPEDFQRLPQVLHSAHEQTARAYRRYLQGRRAGRPRRYFRNRAHALYFLRTVAPTKLVDGAWLYGLLPRWQDRRMAPLIRIYLEELGCGQAAQNHVLLYQNLLSRYGCDHWQDGPEENFTQGVVQLALASHGDEFLPEVIGFNLGYEQLPLHLLITAYELNELDIDPYYFSLHVTIDNAASGHARKALQCVQECAPRLGSQAEFHRRVGNGYRLNLVGRGTLQAIEAFDLEQELLQMLADKALTGACLHSDYCVIEGRPVSDWLSAPESMGDLLRALQNSGWIRRGADPQHSRFWRLLTDEQAVMFGVFTDYEQQLLQDWIVDDPQAQPAVCTSPRVRNPGRFRPCPDTAAVQLAGVRLSAGASLKQIISHHAAQAPAPGSCADVEADVDVEVLFRQLAGVDTPAQAFAVLTGMLSPANHSTPAGLAATRLYSDLFSR